MVPILLYFARALNIISTAVCVAYQDKTCILEANPVIDNLCSRSRGVIHFFVRPPDFLLLFRPRCKHCLHFCLRCLHCTLIICVSGHEALFISLCVLPILFSYFARAVNIVSTSVCGAYIAVASIDIFVNSSRLSEIVWQSIIEQIFSDIKPLILR